MKTCTPSKCPTVVGLKEQIASYIHDVKYCVHEASGSCEIAKDKIAYEKMLHIVYMKLFKGSTYPYRRVLLTIEKDIAELLKIPDRDRCNGWKDNKRTKEAA